MPYLSHRYETPNGTGYYPDIFITCDEDDIGKRVKTNPCLIIEVLSKTTEDIDRGEKLYNYRQSPTLQMYVLVRQDKKFLEMYKRNPDNTWQYSTLEEAGRLEFSCLDFVLTLEEIYEDVPFSA